MRWLCLACAAFCLTVLATPVLAAPQRKAASQAVPKETTSSPAQNLAGRYSHHFLNGLVDGTHYWSDDIVEVVPVADNAAYVRVSLEFYNGHRCELSGVAKVEASKLVYHDPTPPLMDDRACVLSISRSGSNLVIDDDEGSCKDYCGERGSLTNDSLPVKSKRSIRYMDRLKSSDEFKRAMKEWHESLKPSADQPRKTAQFQTQFIPSP